MDWNAITLTMRAREERSEADPRHSDRSAARTFIASFIGSVHARMARQPIDSDLASQFNGRLDYKLRDCGRQNCRKSEGCCAKCTIGLVSKPACQEDRQDFI